MESVVILSASKSVGQLAMNSCFGQSGESEKRSGVLHP